MSLISSQRLGERLAEARKKTKQTQAQVAGALGLARTTVVAIEKGERRPSNAELVAFAKLLGTSVNDLVREGAVSTAVSPRFRLGQRVPESEAAVAAAVERLAAYGARYAELEAMHGLRRAVPPLETLATFRVGPEGPGRADARLEGEDAARVVRAMLGLGDEPFVRIEERLEAEAGLRVFYLDGLPPSLAAFLIWSDAIGACVGINRAHAPARQRWSLAHECGHFLRDREAGDVLDDATALKSQAEVFPEAFAKELLLPAGGVQKRFAERSRQGKFTPVDLAALADAFGVSFQAMTLRLEELRLLARGTYDNIVRSRLPVSRLNPEGSASGAERRRRPELASIELGVPRRYLALALYAHELGQLSERELADVLATDITTARAIVMGTRPLALDDGASLPAEIAASDLRSL